MGKPVEVDQLWQERIAEQLNGLQYGQVVVTVHDGQIVQIDRTERTRYQLASSKSIITDSLDEVAAAKQQNERKAKSAKA